MKNSKRSHILRRGLVAAALLALIVPVRAQEPASFETPQLAGEALVAAAKANDDAALKALTGDVAGDLVQDSSDPVVAADRAHFAAMAEQAIAYEVDGEDRVVITVGEDRWPLPIPLVKGEKGWSFDVESGRAEILARRIGANELAAIALCRDYADAQVAYAAVDRDGDLVREYAQRLISEPGTMNGLYWESEDDDSPLGAVVAPLEDHLAQPDQVTPWNGYYWRILTSQGENVPGGKYDFVINGNMIAGFALVAVPAEYGKTGIMTLMVSHHGEILEKDLGEDSQKIVAAMASFDPDDTWTVVDPEQ